MCWGWLAPSTGLSIIHPSAQHWRTFQSYFVVLHNTQCQVNVRHHDICDSACCLVWCDKMLTTIASGKRVGGGVAWRHYFVGNKFHVIVLLNWIFLIAFENAYQNLVYLFIIMISCYVSMISTYLSFYMKMTQFLY